MLVRKNPQYPPDYNAAVKEVKSRKRKRYINFTDEDRAKIGLYAAENGNNSALKKFRAQFPDLGEVL